MKKEKKKLDTYPYLYKDGDAWMAGQLNRNGHFAGGRKPAPAPEIVAGLHVSALKPEIGGAKNPTNDADFFGAILAVVERNGKPYVYIERQSGGYLAVPASSIIAVYHDRLETIPEVEPEVVEQAIDAYIAETVHPLVAKFGVEPASVAASAAPTVQRSVAATPLVASPKPQPAVPVPAAQGNGSVAAAGTAQISLSGEDVDTIVDALRGELVGANERRATKIRSLLGRVAALRPKTLLAPQPLKEQAKSWVDELGEQAPTDSKTKEDLPSQATDATEEESRTDVGV